MLPIVGSLKKNVERFGGIVRIGVKDRQGVSRRCGAFKHMHS